jgi:hypothetical protein
MYFKYQRTLAVCRGHSTITSELVLTVLWIIVDLHFEDSGFHWNSDGSWQGNYCLVDVESKSAFGP